MYEYEIVITERIPVEGEKYPQNKEVYTQTIGEEFFDLQAIIKAVNSKFERVVMGNNKA